MIDQTMTMRCGSCGVEIEPDEYESCGRAWVHDFARDCCYRMQCSLCAEEEEKLEHERDPTCPVCVAGAPGIRVFWHAVAYVGGTEQRRRSDESGMLLPFFDMTTVRRVAIETARQLMSTGGDAKDWLGWAIEAVTADGEQLMEVPFEFAMPAQDRCEMCAASMGRIAPTDELWTGAAATIWGHAKNGEERDCGNRTLCLGCAARANALHIEVAAAEGLGPDLGCERCQARPEGPWLARIKYKLFSDDPWVTSLERLRQQMELSGSGSDSAKGPWLLR
ncbi:MAG: hypothetical protein L0H73_00080 [Nitrococcus sp.]|nr:hypothetical protein [Nitrococcus sp.]